MNSKEQHPSFLSSSSSSRWWSKDTVAIVTGANKGIGFALVKKFAELGVSVVLTARDNGRGLKAVETLRDQGLHVHFFRLDVSDPASIQSFVSWFKDRFSALDILVNNAGVSFNEIDESYASMEHVETVINTNFYGTKLLTESLLPFFRFSSSRILNISSQLGLLNKLKNPQMKQILEDEERLSEEEIDNMVTLFLQNVKEGTWKTGGWPEVWTDYAVSKVALNAYSKVLAKRYRGRGLSVNCFCPGFTQTTMTRGKGTHSADDAAEIGARLALLPREDLLTGKFYFARSNVVCSKL